MKKLSHSILLVLLCTVFPLKSNGQNISSESIMGDWVFNYEASMNLTNNEARAFYGKMDSSQKDKLKGAYRNRRITFGNGGRFLQQLPNGKVQEATWVLNRDNSINVSGASGYSIRFRIKRAEGNTLVIMPQKPDGKSANMLFPEWYLTRI